MIICSSSKWKRKPRKRPLFSCSIAIFWWITAKSWQQFHVFCLLVFGSAIHFNLDRKCYKSVVSLLEETGGLLCCLWLVVAGVLDDDWRTWALQLCLNASSCVILLAIIHGLESLRVPVAVRIASFRRWGRNRYKVTFSPKHHQGQTSFKLYIK